MCKTGVNTNAGEVVVAEQFVEFVCPCYRLDEDNDLDMKQCSQFLVMPRIGRTKPYLVELELIEELVELPVLRVFLELDVVLLQTVKGELRLVINEDFERLA